MKAVVLFSGGADSTVALALALENGRECLALSFDYGQRHRIELEHAAKIAEHYGVTHKVIKLDSTAFGNSALLNNDTIAKNRSTVTIKNSGIPNTYVPARNTIFLAYAMGVAEEINAGEIYAGPTAMDVTGYPDCRPEYIRAVQGVINLATKQSIEGKAPQLITPLIHMDKIQIFQEGKRLNAPLELTFSCYDPLDDKACGQCDACQIRRDGLQALLDSLS